MKKRQSELMSELCKVRGEGGKERESSSFSINYCREHESVPLWGSDNERTWGKNIYKLENIMLMSNKWDKSFNWFIK